MVQDGQDDFVHILPEADVYLLLFFQGLHQLISRGAVYLRGQGLGFRLGGKQVLGLVETDAEDLAVQLLVLLP